MSAQGSSSRLAEIRLLYQDENVLVIDKPSCMHSVSQAGSDDSLAHWIVQHFPVQAEMRGGPQEEAGLIQRLDFETSGVIVAARNRLTWEFLRQLLQRGEIHKSYLAVLEGSAPAQQAVRSFLGPRHRGSKKVSCWERKPRGVRALEGETAFTHLASLHSHSLVRATAPLARRHQVRAHASRMGHPLVGDVLYGSAHSLSQVFEAKRTPPFFLHAESLLLKLPNGTQKQIESPLPSYAECLAALLPIGALD